MSRHLRASSFRSLVQSPARQPRVKFFRPKLDSLEDRTVPAQVDLTGFAANLSTDLATLQSGINTALDVASQVPFLNKQLGQTSEARVFTNTLLNDLHSVLGIVISAPDDNALNTAIHDTVQSAVFNLLGPSGSGPHLLAAHDGSGNTPTANDVIVTVNTDHTFAVDMRLHQGLIDSTKNFGLNLGLQGVPFKVETSGSVNVKVGFDYELAFNFGGASVFSVDTSKTLQGNGAGHGHEMSLNVTASLPNTPQPFAATVIVGFLEGQAADHAGGTSMNLAFNLDGLDPTTPSLPSPSVSGAAHLDLDLTGGFRDGMNNVSTEFPSIRTEFKLDWGFNTGSANTDLPVIEFDTVQLQLGSFISKLLMPVLKDIQEVTQPLQPVVDALKAPIPGLSDLSHSIGGGDISLESLAKDIGPSTPYSQIISLVTTIVDIVDTVNHINVGDANGIWVPLGSFKIGGPGDPNGDLRNLLPAGDPTAGLANLSSLLPFDPSGLQSTIDDALSGFSGPAADQAKQALDQLTNPDGIKLTFPLFTDPVHSLFKLLLGQDADFVRFAAHYSFDDTEEQEFGFSGIVVRFGGTIHLDAGITIAYDTFGIRKFLNDPNKDATDFLDGLYIDNSPDPTDNNLPLTHVSIKGEISAGLGVGIADLASLTINGGVSTGDGGNEPVTLTLVDPDNDGQGADGKLRASELADDISNFPNCIFDVSGKLEGSLFIELRVGVDVPFVGFVGYEHDFPLASGTILDFTTHSQCNPSTPPPPPVLASQPDANGQVTLFMGPNAGQRRNVPQDADPDADHIDETYEISHLGGSPGDETIGVTAYGYTQRIDHVKSVFGDGGDGNDSVTVDKGVLAAAELHGGIGNDNLTYLGSDHAKLYGDAGDDHLTAGPNAQTSELHGGGGNDYLAGGGGADQLYGEGGPSDTDVLIAGPGNNQQLHGGQGNDQFEAGAGSSQMVGGDGNDLFTWHAGNGPITVDGQAGSNILELDGSDNADAITAGTGLLSHLSIQANGTAIDAAGITELNVETGDGADTATFNDLTGTSVHVVAVNAFSEGIGADGSLDTFTLNGHTGPKTVDIAEAPVSGTHPILVNGQVVIVPASGTVTQVTGMGPGFLVANPEDKLVINPGDGDTTVNVATTTQGGELDVNGGIGTDVYNVRSISGPTTISAQGGFNTFNVGSQAPIAGGTLGGIKAALTINGSGGTDTANVDDTGDTTGRTDGLLTDTKLTGLGMSGSITYAGLAALNVNLGTGDDSFEMTGIAPTTVTTVDGGPVTDAFDGNFPGDFAGTLFVKHFETITMEVAGDFSGSFTASNPGNVQSIAIGGSLTTTGTIQADNIGMMTVGQDYAGTVNVTQNIGLLAIGGTMTITGLVQTGGDLDEMTIGPDMYSPGHDMAGRIIVGGTLGDLRVAGGTPGTIQAGHIGTVRVYGGFGPLMLQLKENGIQRRVEVAVPDDPYPLPAPPPAPPPSQSPADVRFQYVYEGSLFNPQMTIRAFNTSGNTGPDQYDLSLVVYNDVAKFNLARLDANGVSGVRNVAVEGDILTHVTAGKVANFFKVGTGIDTNPAGVRLPLDKLAGVAVRDFAPNASIQAASIQSVAFGSHTNSNGTIGTGAAATATNAAKLLATGTSLAPAADTYRVPFADLPTQQLAEFLVTSPSGGKFDSNSIVLIVQGVSSPNAAGTANVVTPSNVARGAVTALVTAVPTFDSRGRPLGSAVQSIALRGDGGSIRTAQAITDSITSTGPLGDLTLQSSQPVPNVTAPSIFGSLVAGGAVDGIVQTTGMWTDPITGAVSSITPDLGRLYVDTSGKVPVVAATVIQTGGISGEVVSRGDLISSITANGGSLTGVVAAQGNLGKTFTSSSGQSTRLGGILSDGRFTGTIAVLGSVIGDMRFNGGLKFGGRIAAKGGIVGNLRIDGGLDSTGAIVSGGEIGDPTLGTKFTFNGSNKGILASKGAMNFDGGAPGGALFNNVGNTGANANAIDAIFTDHGTPLGFDVGPLDLAGLDLILADLYALRVGSGGTLTGPVP
jgi:RTX calcium-binding nonapeptide repeat (4 copies)